MVVLDWPPDGLVVISPIVAFSPVLGAPSELIFDEEKVTCADEGLTY